MTYNGWNSFMDFDGNGEVTPEEEYLAFMMMQEATEEEEDDLPADGEEWP